MSVKTIMGRAILLTLSTGALFGACSGDEDTGSDTDEQNQTSDAGTTDALAGNSAARAGRGGSAANNKSTAGRAGSAGQQGPSKDKAGSGAAGTPQQAGSSGASAGAGGSVDASKVTLSEGQIIAVMAAVNSAEIGSSTLAQSRAVAPAVLDFANSMATVHDTAQKRQSALATSLSLTPEPSPLSVQIGDDAVRSTAELTAASAAEFDALYLRTQIDAHMKVLMLISEQLLPAVKNDMLRAELTLTRDEVATHLDGARAAADALANSDTDAGTP